MAKIKQIIPCYRNDFYFHFKQDDEYKWEDPVVAFALVEEPEDGATIVRPLIMDKEGLVKSPHDPAYRKLDVSVVEKEKESVLVVVGTDKKSELGKEILKFEHPDFFDRVFFEEPKTKSKLLEG